MRMKRQRENKRALICGENDFSPLPSEGSVLDGTVALACSQHSLQRQSRRRSIFLPRNLWIGACFVAVLSGIASLPVAHASTRNIASAKSNVLDSRGDAFVWHRRIEEEESEFESESPDEAEPLSSPSNIEECTVPAGKCIQCTYSEQKTFDACKENGRWQKFMCPSPDNEGSEKEDDARHEMLSCKHTDLENGIAMFQFQILCLVIGVLSIVSVKKQKKLSLSMFERRKQQGAAVVSRSNPITGSNKRNDEEDIEFTPMTNQQRERVPLVARMEII